MRKSIRLIALALALLCAVSAFAQPERRWGVTMGGNYNEIHFKQSDIFESDRMFGGSVGVTGDLMIPGVGFGVDASVLYTLFVLKTNHMWVVKVKENGVTLKCPAPGFQAPFSVGKGGDFKVPDVSWMLSINAQRHNPLLFWKKSGYYVLWTGSPISVKNEYKEEVAVCEPNEETRLCTLKSGGIFIIEKDNHKVELAI